MNIRYLTVSDVNYFSHVAALFHSLSAQGQDELYWGHIEDGCVHLRRITAGGIDLVQANVALVPKSDTIVEASTRFRPLLLQSMFDVCDCEIGCYVDPDIFVYGPMEELLDSSASASAWITPHLLASDVMDASDAVERERAISQALSLQRWGAYNMGIYFVRNNTNGRRFLRCYQSFLDRACAMESLYSFVDQKWMDVLASMFPGQVEALRHPGINLSYWNLPYRKLAREGEAYYVNGAPLKAIHFSGVGVGRINCDYGEGIEIKALITDYQRHLRTCKVHHNPPAGSLGVKRLASQYWRRLARKVMFYFLQKLELR